MREGHGDGGEGDVGEAVPERVQERRQRHRLQELLVGLLVLHQARGPGGRGRGFLQPAKLFKTVNFVCVVLLAK